jgi:hypothetical protein
MLTIRDAQLEVLARDVARGLARRIAEGLRSRSVFAALALDEEALFTQVGWGIELARSYRFTDMAALQVFVNLLFEIDPGYHCHPQAQKILADRSLSDRRRVRALLDWLSAGGWLACRRPAHDLSGQGVRND